MSTQPRTTTWRFVVLFTLLSCAAAFPAQTPGGLRGVQDVTTDSTTASQEASYYALVIGNSNYKFPNQLPTLQTPRADASAIAQLLHDQYGFETRVLLDASRADILGALVDFRRSLHQNSNLVIFYAGHGNFDSQADQAYWLPVDARTDDNSNWISMDDITSRVRPLASKHVLVISDSCYSGAILADESAGHRTRGIVGGIPTEYAQYLAKMSNLTSRDWMASGSMEPVEDGGAPGHSIFANALLQGLQQTPEPQFSAQDLFYSFVKRKVAGSSLQLPQYGSIRDSGDDLGDFVFVRKGAPATTAATSSTPPTTTATSSTPPPTTPPPPRQPPEQGARKDVFKKLAPPAEFCYFDHENRALDDTEYVTCLQSGVNAGHARSMAYLGQMYLIGGGGLDKNQAQAVSWYRKAADLGDALGMTNLAWAYENGTGGLPVDQQQALHWYTKGADTGDPGAMRILAGVYREGRAGVQPDEKQAMIWCQRAAEAGNIPAMLDLASGYQLGVSGLRQDYAEARKWYGKAADAGNAFAMRKLGDCYVEGSCGVPKDLRQARSWFEKAAASGDKDSMLWLGHRYEEGSDGFPKDHAKAQEWLQKAAEDPHQKALEAARKLKN
jgi:TPR repeat protein/uncharacterized caspase-like protein